MIRILNYVYGQLTANSDVTDYVGEDIFPIIVPDKGGNGEQIRFPHIVMNRLSVSPIYTKGCVQDNAEVEVVCWHTSYIEIVDLAEKVRETLEFIKGTIDGVTVDTCRLQSIDEGFSEVAYFQRLVFTFK